ncbi:hypothetical protein GCM10008018_37210 [Paenibacillus marchantiophytorum]|uniref:Uncharacterized protein n=1 Tax=Paenibacillus marchantiophytorum TaxID=1619310 RepID=A0ABQ1EU37_9BACL|nr:hypothetical protein GCM10008018_37210 [Paenibacillus marchantiophytorum]
MNSMHGTTHSVCFITVYETRLSAEKRNKLTPDKFRRQLVISNEVNPYLLCLSVDTRRLGRSLRRNDLLVFNRYEWGELAWSHQPKFVQGPRTADV